MFSLHDALPSCWRWKRCAHLQLPSCLYQSETLTNSINALARSVRTRYRSPGEGGPPGSGSAGTARGIRPRQQPTRRSEEHTSELQSLMRISYAVFCLKKKKIETNAYNKE